MSDLETLSIELRGSSADAIKHIDKVIEALGRLNAQLNNYSPNSPYIKGLNSLTGGFRALSNVTASINPKRVEALAKAVGTLATKGASVAQLNFAQPLNKMGEAAANSSMQIKNMAKEIAEMSGITSKQGLKDITAAVSNFYKSVGNETALNNAEKELGEIIKEYSELGKAVDDTSEKIRKWVSSTSIKLPKNASKEFLDDFSRLRGTLGIKNTSNDKGIGLDSMLMELDEKFGTSFYNGNVMDSMEKLAKELSNGNAEMERYTEQEREGITESEKYSAVLDKLYQSVNMVREAQAELDKNTMLGAVGDYDGEELLDPFSPEGIESLDQAAVKADKANENIETLNATLEDSIQIGNPFEGLVTGLQSLTDINISAEQFSGVKVIADSLGKFGGVNIDRAKDLLPQLASGLDMFNHIEIPDIGAKLYVLADGLGQLGHKSQVNAQSVGLIAEGLKKFEAVQWDKLDTIKISLLGSAIAKLGYKNMDAAIANIPKLSEAFISLTNSLANAPKVSAETIRLAEALAQLAVASRGASTGTQQTSTGITMLRGAIQAAMPTFSRMQKRTFSLAAMFGKLYASYFLVIRAFRSLGGAINISSSLTEVQNVVATTFGNMTYKLDEFAERSIYDFGMAELSAKQYASRFQSMGSAMGITAKQVSDSTTFLDDALKGQKRITDDLKDNYEDLGDSMADMSINLTKLVGDYASFYNMDYDDVAKDFEAIFTGQTRPMRIYGIDLTNATLKEWALEQGLDADIKKMTQAEKTMLRYQYVMARSGKVMNDYQITMDNWANVLRTISEQFTKFGQYVGTGFINIFKPVLIKFRDFMNGFLGLVEKGLNAVGHLLGWEVELEEVGTTMDDDMNDYADALDDAAGNAKKLNSQLRAIDEINNLTTNKGSGSGSGDDGSSGFGGATGGGLKFKEIPSVFESDIDSWKELGTRIRDKILEGFKSIDWDDIKNKVSLNAEGLSNLLNGFFERDENGENIGMAFGKFLAKGISLGFTWLKDFAGTLNWSELGGNISGFINNFFENLDTKDAADAANNLANGLWTMFTTALFGDKKKGIKGIDGQKIVSTVFDFISHLNWDTKNLIVKGIEVSILSATISKVGAWAFSSLIPMMLTKSLETFLRGSKIAPNIAVDVTDSTATGVSSAIASPKVNNAAQTLGKTIGIAVASYAVTQMIKYDYESGHVQERAEMFNHGRKDDKLDKDAAYAYAQASTYSATNANANLDMWIMQTLFGKLFDKWFHNDEPFDIVGEETEIGKSLVRSVEESAMEETSDTGSNITKGITQSMENESKSENTKSKAQQVKEWILKSLRIAFGIESPATTAYPIGENIVLGIFEGFNLVDFASKMQEWWNSNVKPWFTVEKWSELASNIKTGISLKWDEFTNWWQNTALAKWWDEKVKPWFSLEKWEETFSPIFDAMSGVWDRIKQLFNDGFDVKTPHFKWDSAESTMLPEGVKKALETIGLPTSIPKLSVEWYAQGGYPTTGSLFYAGESGAELLGSVNGRTTVASNGEITGISDTIRSTSAEEIALLRQQNTLLQAILQKEFGITKNQIFKSVQESAKEWKKQTGNPAW